jgi:hypothetical protein
MSNFAGDEEKITYTEPEGALIYRGEIILASEYKDDRVGLCVTMHGGGDAVAVGIGDEGDIQQFLYEAAVRSKLIKDGEPLILMKRVSADAEDVA